MVKVNSRSFRHAMGGFATGVTVITTHDPELGRVGITINSLTSVSLEPPLVLFCLDKKAHLHPAFRRAEMFAVNILAAGQEDVSRHFANYHRYPEPPKIWTRPRQGCPILHGTVGWLLCRKTKAYKGGDHTIFMGEVVDVSKVSEPSSPLLYFRRGYIELKDKRDIGG
jgi:flavin reductase (DIM6/NTAB) family NADH-FMN oxidoreductase RutF